MVHTAESRYVHRTAYHSRYTHPQGVARHESDDRHFTGLPKNWMRSVTCVLPKFIPFLTRQCRLEFRGRVLEIGAGAAWFSAEISKLPNVVEIVATDLSPRVLKEHAPEVFRLLNANAAKITRTPGDCHKLDFPGNHFDYVICSAVLHGAANIVQVLREAKRVLKPGGRFVAIREPIWPLVRIKSPLKVRARLAAAAVSNPFYTLADYQEFFRQAGLPTEALRVNLARGFKDHFNKLVNGFTHARYAFIATKGGALRECVRPRT